ncbi:unnamed protein product [Adineta ricciae]|uniref:mitogen-activated protein kinase kinase n=1 Tax=Adineta ricciae TaxID=249248 RepID=A0A814ZUD4_ADIRI|nr:unnamed protein product [Adineta ricciae]CAF1536225.1 unnamed protein product [Adineta ricciae]
MEEKQLVHRDIKPANILLNKDGDIKICDFGVTGDLSKRSEYTVRTGDPLYRSPQRETCAIESDMWAFGMTLLEVINGKHPFAEPDPNNIAWMIDKWKPEFSTKISDDINDLVSSLLRKDRQNRPSSYADILEKPCICGVSTMPTDDVRKFIRDIIKSIL